MFEPENQDVECPKCSRREVYFDHDMGFYCMACGKEFTEEEAELLFEYERLHVHVEDDS